LHLVGGDLSGGAARGAYWLHQALKRAGIGSTILTNSRQFLDDEDIVYTSRSRRGKVANLLRSQLDNLPLLFFKCREQDSFSTGLAGFDFTKTKAYQEADLLHLHWINGGFVNIKHLSKVAKPVVWTIRDMWPMTGGCHYSMDCENYKQQCGNCTLLEKSSGFDLSRWVLNRKIKYLRRNTVIIGISNWLSEAARQSSIFREFDIRTIHNNINTDDFFPVEKATARAVLGISTDKKIILAGAQGLTSFYKGFDRFRDALKQLDAHGYLLIFFGRLDAGSVKDLGFEYRSFGFLQDTVSLRLAYSAADVFVAPSRMEAFGKTLAESMACGTPVVCFDATGPRDIVDHRANGYKARPFDAHDLADGIRWVLGSSDHRTLAENAREKIVTAFDSRIIAEKYKKLYEEMVSPVKLVG
jgi:glycosyltransferase involved in cell wall biosynthesis